MVFNNEDLFDLNDERRIPRKRFISMDGNVNTPGGGSDRPIQVRARTNILLLENKDSVTEDLTSTPQKVQPLKRHKKVCGEEQETEEDMISATGLQIGGSSEAMIVNGWNCCGMATSRAVLALLEVQRQTKPDVMFLSESHLAKAKAEKLRRKLKFDKMSCFESNGRSGGLILFWKKNQNCGKKGGEKLYRCGD